MSSKAPSRPAADGALAEGVYRPSMVAAYRANPRGAVHAGFDAERMVPRWRWVLIGLLLIAATALVGLLIRVPVGPTGTLAGTTGRDAVLAFPSLTPPAKGSDIVLRLDKSRTVTGRVKDTQAGQGGVQVTMVLVELPAAFGLDSVEDGTQVVLDQGTRPLLLDIWDGGNDQ
ncbi:hypothetical protein SSP24_55940 [Streptomyces spinoverrucosus]|uniref:Uncharacterized protein n=1 Tax=Streptomyces spinoverrucosus TaxID=284043 RepID=A0A4Y3VQI5_9ACTN|nr:hypothetical protein [Streptomyces spinoverrucosus]GEC07939.1 hypothetical protein SSP24_55940 [Streptomyces spinoverrucosus]GHB85867.1 hypothetical protein GCM10010397_66600 [Streptomyces spinoverrucosus]